MHTYEKLGELSKYTCSTFLKKSYICKLGNVSMYLGKKNVKLVVYILRWLPQIEGKDEGRAIEVFLFVHRSCKKLIRKKLDTHTLLVFN